MRMSVTGQLTTIQSSDNQILVSAEPLTGYMKLGKSMS